jgi:hypothetical protein
MTAFLTYMLVIILIIVVVAMNYSILTDEQVRKSGLLKAFTLKKTYIWFAGMLVVLSAVVILND